MENIISTVNWIIFTISNALLLLLLVSSLLEKENRAALISFLIVVVNSGLWMVLHFFMHFKWVQFLNLGLLILLVIFAIVSVIRFFPSKSQRDLSSIQPFDERDHMFSRNNLKWHPQLAEKYYGAHPEKKEIDEKIHGKPELEEPGRVFYDSYYTPFSDAVFYHLAQTRSAAWGEPFPKTKQIDSRKVAQIIRELALFYGAVDVGITLLKSYHLYSHTGRHAENWGEEIQNNHCTAIVIVVKMDVTMIKSAPALPVVLESSRQYVEAAKIANIIAAYLRCLGYAARAHTDGNYQLMCVPAAVDAGLGTLGRIGLLMHPVYGPCVRISVVTTELELPPTTNTKKSHPRNLQTIEHFCHICKKCADNCPTQSIGKGEEPFNRGFRHWSINQETCFSYWKTIGTDCGFCIRVCPYTKPNTLMHKLVRFYISRNALNQQIALFLDDLFYGRKQPLATKNPKKIL
ncbi:MAG: reductive dehalogenase domain-containing protein [Candidatus Aminicenantes bacterium]|jgi:ferredoxin